MPMVDPEYIGNKSVPLSGAVEAGGTIRGKKKRVKSTLNFGVGGPGRNRTDVRGFAGYAGSFLKMSMKF